MIDPNVFAEAWERICRRFRQTSDPQMGADYLAYLNNAGLTTEAFLAQTEAVWAVREFFPRPADFLAGEAATGWTAILEFARRWSVHLSADDARALVGAIPPRAKAALDSLGGVDVVRGAKDTPRIRREFFDAFESVVVEESTRMALLPAKPQLALAAPNDVAVAVGIDAEPGRLNVRLLKHLAGEPVA